MLRSLFAGILAVAAVSACSKDAAPTAQPGAIAGKVVEVTGSVSVVHGGETKPLTQGATVLTDDEIVTGADGRASIVLAHNNARWDVAPGTRKKVSESAAWGLAKVDHPAEVSGEATSAAGRDQEKAGAQTGATANVEVSATTTTPPPPADTAPHTDQPSPGRGGETGGRRAPGGEGGDGGGGGPKAKADMVMHDEAQKREDPKHAQAMGQSSDDKEDKDANIANLPAKTSKPLMQPMAPPANPPPGTFAGEVEPRMTKLTACLPAKSKTELKLSVAKGKVTFTLSGTPSAEMRECVAKIVATMKFTTDGTMMFPLARD